MSNYLFVAGRNSSVNPLKTYFESIHDAKEEISSTIISNELSIFVIERRNSDIKSSIVSNNLGEGVFFRGQALDHESSSMILGVEGFAHFQKENPEFSDPARITDFEGSFVLARWDQKVLTFESDLYSVYRLLYFASEDILIVSDSLVLIVECMKALKIKREMNKDVVIMKAWNASGLPNAPFTKELIVKGVYTLQVGKHIELDLTNQKLSAKCIERPVSGLFETSTKSYEELLKDCAIRMYSSINFVVKSFNPVITFGLSGGIDSRLLLALCLKSDEIMSSMIINTNSSPTRVNDFRVVEQLAEKYQFTFNDSERRKNILSTVNVKRITIENKLGFWKLASLGTYDSFYLTPSYYESPCILSMTGVGAEPVKQAMDKSRIENIAKSQHPKVREMVRRKLSETIQSMGISPTADNAMKWYLLSHKAAYHLGFQIARSSMLLRPYVQKSIFSIALHDDNPFRGKENIGPTVLHDIMILLNPELAAHAYDSDSKNITIEYVNNRVQELGGIVDLTEIPEPSVFGKIEHIANGPANSFLNVVKDFKNDESESLRNQLKNMVIDNYENKIPLQYKEIYLSCYQNTIKSLDDEGIELSAAGALAARFLVFDLFDTRERNALEELELTQNSLSYRVGRFLTWGPRKIHKILQNFQNSVN